MQNDHSLQKLRLVPVPGSSRIVAAEKVPELLVLHLALLDRQLYASDFCADLRHRPHRSLSVELERLVNLLQVEPVFLNRVDKRLIIRLAPQLEDAVLTNDAIQLRSDLSPGFRLAKLADNLV